MGCGGEKGIWHNLRTWTTPKWLDYLKGTKHPHHIFTVWSRGCYLVTFYVHNSVVSSLFCEIFLVPSNHIFSCRIILTIFLKNPNFLTIFACCKKSRIIFILWLFFFKFHLFFTFFGGYFSLFLAYIHVYVHCGTCRQIFQFWKGNFFRILPTHANNYLQISWNDMYLYQLSWNAWYV